MAEKMLFSRSLYSPEALREAVKAFEHLGKFELTLGDDEMALTLSDPDPEVADVLLDELGNYALARTVQNRTD